MSGKRAIPILTVAGGLAAALGYVWTIVVGRLVSTTEYADFSAGAAIVYFSVTALTPLAQTMSYFVATSRGAGMQRRLLIIVFASGALATAMATLFAAPLARLLRFGAANEVVLIALSLTMTAALNVRRGVQLGERRWTDYARNISIESVARIVFAAALLLVRPNASAAIASFVLASAIGVVIAGRWPAASDAAPELGVVGRYLAPAVAYTAVYAAIQNVDVVMVKRLFPAADAGAYGAASLLARGAGMLVLPFYAYAVPHLVEAAGDPAEMRRRLLRMCAQYVALAGAAVAVFGGAGRWIVALLFGARYAGAAPLLLPLSMAIALSGLSFLLCQLPVARNRFGFVPFYAAALLIEIALLVFQHPTTIAVAWEVVAANVVTLALILPFVRPSPSPRTPAAACSG